MSPVLEFRSVSKTFGTGADEVIALDDVNLTIERGEFISLIGPSGCGKSTLLNLAAGLLSPTTGEVDLNDRPVVGPPPEVGVMFQKPVLLDWRTARSNVLLPIETANGRRAAKAASQRADDLLKLVGLAGFENRYPSELSGGMQQRVAICRMLIANPEVLLLDEPFGALDELTRERMNVELASIVGQTGDAAVLVTHNMSEAIFLADRVVVMTSRPGRIAGIVHVPFERPRSLELLSSQGFLEAVREVRVLLESGHEEVEAA